MSHGESSEKGLLLEEYKRYGRQMIVQGFGLPGTLKLYYQYLQYYRLLNAGQISLKSSSVVVVGAGGLGCPALQYLAAAGVGTLALQLC